ncbi:MAG: heavy-metal-associated domain-containing protein [Clostridiales bacterium]|nr:heavy-metal-associated domain-containing protein [Candidatus Apopatocola equi]MCQ2438603.1 heavy-metal-associated domain-containing protein [Oscillospiraceae bacterium]
MRELSVTYMKCQSCAAKVNCHECDAYLRDDLSREEGIEAVEVDMKARRISLETEMDEDELEETLEDRGLFV